MYCGRCGASDNGIITQNIEQDGDTVIISYFGICKQCGELLGIKEFYKNTDWDCIDPKIVKETLENFKGKGKYIKRKEIKNMEIKIGTNFYHPTYGECIVENYDDTSNMYIARRKGGSEIFYVTGQQIRGGM